MVLRYFNVAGADPQCRTGQSTNGATHLIKVAVEAALGLRPKLDVFGTDYPTPDGTCVRDYIHVSDLVRAHSMRCAICAAAAPARRSIAATATAIRCCEVIDTVKHVSGVDFKVEFAAAPARRSGADRGSFRPRPRDMLGWKPALDDLATIVANALAWERELTVRQSVHQLHRAVSYANAREPTLVADRRA